MLQQRRVLDHNGNLPEIILAPIPQKLRPLEQQESARVIMETKITQSLIQSYFSIVQKNIADLIPKTVMAFLVRESIHKAHAALVREVYQYEKLPELLVEDPIIAANRRQCREMIGHLRQAQNLLAEVT